MIKKFTFYCLRWQLSTPILAPVLIYCEGLFSVNTNVNFFVATMIANFIGACIFFWVDKFIFRTKLKNPLWEIEDNYQCFDCGKEHCRCYRLVKAKHYDRLDDTQPEFRCETCSEKRTEQLRKRGVKIP